MRKPLVLIAAAVAGAFAGCSKPDDASQRNGSDKVRAEVQGADQALIDPCSLLTSEEIASVQGEPVKDSKPLQETAGGLTIAQCHFALPTYIKSINLWAVQKANGPEGRDPRQVWNETFTPENLAQAGTRAPEAVPDVGEQAFWRSDRKSGALYVLKGNRYLRIGMGGPDDKETKIRKCSELARAALSRL